MKIYPFISIFFSTIFTLFFTACRPTNIQQKYQEAYSLASKNDTESWIKANKILKELRAYNKKDDNFLAFYAISELKVDNNTFAEEYIKKAIEINPKNSLYYYFLADIYYQKNEYSNAIGELIKCLKLDPDNIEAFILLVKAERWVFSYRKPQTFFTESQSIKKLDSQKFRKLPQTLNLLAAKHYHYTEMLKAFFFLKEAEKLDANNPETILNIAIVSDVRQIKDLAKKYYLKYLEKTTSSKKYLETRVQVTKRLKEIQ